MLHAWHHPHTGELRLYVRLDPSLTGARPVEAWIAQTPQRSSRQVATRHGRDWVLWVRSEGRMTLEKCPARLEVQSLLRAWLIQRYRRPLFLMSFAQLCVVARKDRTPSDVRRAPAS